MRMSQLALALVFASSLFAAKPAPVQPVMHGNAFKGTVVSMDAKTHMFQVRSGASTTTFAMTQATKVTGGAVKVGETVDVRYMAKAGRNTATSVAIAPAPKAAVASAVAVKPATGVVHAKAAVKPAAAPVQKKN